MRIRPSPGLVALGALVGLAATTAVASAHPKPAAPTCGCHAVRRHVAVHIRRHAHIWRQAQAPVEHHVWRGERRWGEERGWSEERQSSEGETHWAFGHEGRWGYGEDQRPSATDRFGFLTWPGKTHFIHGQPVEGDFDHGAGGGWTIRPPMAPPPEGAMPPPPPPPEGWRGGPDGDRDGDSDEGYEIRRF